jgi:hypothetical protein
MRSRRASTRSVRPPNCGVMRLVRGIAQDSVAARRERGRNMTTSEQSHYALEKYADAVEALATGPGELRGRLTNVRQFLFRITPSMVPVANHIRKDVTWILAQLRKPTPGRSSLRNVRSKQLEAIATHIYLVFWRLHDYEQRRA